MTTFANANCTDYDVETFFPQDADRAGIRAARAICKGCPVIAECLEFALNAETGHMRHGIYGGMTPRMRGDLARRMARESA